MSKIDYKKAVKKILQVLEAQEKDEWESDKILQEAVNDNMCTKETYEKQVTRWASTLNVIKLITKHTTEDEV